jgi:hypothetical protein
MLDLGIGLKPGIIDQDVKGAEMFGCCPEHSRHIILIADIAFQQKGAAPDGLDLLRQMASRIVIGDIIYRHIRSGSRHGQSDRPANAGIGAGYEGRLITECPRRKTAEFQRPGNVRFLIHMENLLFIAGNVY